MKRHLKKWYLTFFPLVYHIFPLVLKCYCKVKPNTSGGYCNHIANNMHYNRVRWGIDRVLIRRHHFCQVRISVDYKSYHADQKLLEKVSNLSKLSLINLTYKYKLAYLNEKIHTSQHYFHFVYHRQFKTCNSKFTFNDPCKQSTMALFLTFCTLTQPWFCSKTLFDS